METRKEARRGGIRGRIAALGGGRGGLFGSHVFALTGQKRKGGGEKRSTPFENLSHERAKKKKNGRTGVYAKKNGVERDKELKLSTTNRTGKRNQRILESSRKKREMESVKSYDKGGQENIQGRGSK